ncbi:Gfo/Idh/MocA family protein [Acuticoccus sediminis]|uniref:Gfo/Idh/MocA family protein n=1 Tax=Acuticoccus sediminis TaxID=2184697 RepID=UPI001CFDC2CA|nr:Gfo/Idh/MocA family oxidoreductase [Acuticoccus sediminis]
MTVTDVAIVGVGKIARDQHVPAIEASGDFRLAATVSRSGGVDGVDNFATLDALLAARPDIPAISFCNPPQVRYAGARAALEAGRHVMLEKPPGASLSEVHDLAALAEARGLTLQATWHSRHAASVAAAKAFLAGRRIRSVRIDWKEDVRVWHPGQQWIWQAGGLGVFDPAINAFSILTEILPVPVHVTAAELRFPVNCETPIAAEVEMAGPRGERVLAALDFLHEGDPMWRQVVETDAGTLTLDQGGAIMSVDGGAQQGEAWTAPGIEGEYPSLYARFAELLAARTCEVDLRPMVLVADAFTLGRRVDAPAFVDPALAGDR